MRRKIWTVVLAVALLSVPLSAAPGAISLGVEVSLVEALGQRVVSWWQDLLSLWQKAGSEIDPSGVSGKAGSEIDPSGQD